MFNTDSNKIPKQIAGLLINRWALSCLAILTFQQAIEASATFWLVKMMASVTQGEPFLTYLVIYLATLAFPYIPGCIALILKTHWKQEAQRYFINAFVASNRNNIGEWNNKAIREEKLSILTSEGPAALHALIDYVLDLTGYVLSVFFNILALSIVVEPLFALAYGISVTCVIIVMKLKRRTQRFLTKKALTARVDLSQSLLASWDNVLLGNDYNFKLWDEKTSQRIKRCLQRNIDLERFDQVLAIFASLMTSIPSLAVVVYSLTIHQADKAVVTSYIVILPLLFMILSYTYQTLSLAFRWGMHKSKLTAIYKAIQPTRDAHALLERKVKWAKIVASLTKQGDQIFSTAADPNRISLAYPRPIESHTDLLQQTSSAGRLTLRGENGSGKSTALMLIKNALGRRAFFLPTHNQLSFSSETNKHSTGESLKNRLLEILEKVDVDVLLLDEWDANLDKENQEKLSTLIDELSQKKCVIEVRHR
jgi:ABC-type transport system involved in cytochrome bd biosynthesis fused ATPase/permease subunit